MQNPRSRDKHQEEPHGPDHHDRTKVRFGKDGKRDDANQDRRPKRAAHEEFNLPARLVKPNRKKNDGQELCELARLEAKRPDGNPTMRSVDRSKAKNRHKKHHDHDEEQPGQDLRIPPFAIVEHRHRNRQNDTNDQIGELPLDEEIRVTMQTHGVRLARARENDKA